MWIEEKLNVKEVVWVRFMKNSVYKTQALIATLLGNIIYHNK